MNALLPFLGGMLLAGLGTVLTGEAPHSRAVRPVAGGCSLFLPNVLDMLQLWHLYAAGLVGRQSDQWVFPHSRLCGRLYRAGNYRTGALSLQ
ncbi:MAG: hypothetical protein ACLSUW_04325 [Akkermansia sp.]